MWDGGPVGVAETTYPHPHGWRLRGAPEGTTLEGVTIRLLTEIARAPHQQELTCIRRWPGILGQIDMDQVLARLSSPLLTPRDFKNWYRVLNRAVATRNRMSCPDTTCRLCGRSPERFSHLAQCPEIRQVFTLFRDFAVAFVPRLQVDAKLIYLGLHGSEVLPGSLAALHVIVWKFVLIAFTRADVTGERFVARRIWRQAVRRFEVRVEAYGEGFRRWAHERGDRGEGPPPPQVLDRHAQVLLPCARPLDEGGVAYTREMRVLSARMTIEEARARTRNATRRRERERRRRTAPAR